MDEYAIRFFALLAMAYKMNATHLKEMALAAGLYQFKDDDRRSILASLDAQERDIVEMLAEESNYEGLETLKGILDG